MCEPDTLSTALRTKASPMVTHPVRKKNKLCWWNPSSSWSLTLSRIAPIIMGNSPKAKFWSISISPKAVPNSLAFTIIGRVGTMIAQNIPVPIPRKPTGIHLTTSDDRREVLV